MNNLTDLSIKKTKPEDKPYKMTDGDGLYLFVIPTGSKYWRLAYRFGGKQKTLALGVYPDVGLADARSRRDDARKLLANNVDPGVAKQAQKAVVIAQTENSFEAIAREWFTRHAPNWKENHSSKIIARLEKDVFPWVPAQVEHLQYNRG